MKKVFVAILAILYLGTSTGATIHLHYCMDKFIGWDLGSKNDGNCSKCGMSKEQKKQTKGCCKDDYQQFKLKTDHKTTESLQIMQTFQEPISNLYVELPAVYVFSTTEKKPRSHAPPQSSGTPVYLLNCIFRI
jgi:hypothetical protein